MNLTHSLPTVEDLRALFEPIFRRHCVLQAWLFGSYARGEPSPHSDIDLIVVMQTDRRFLDRYEPILFELNEVSPAPVELLIYTPQEFRRMRERAFIRQALSEAVLLYESDRRQNER